MTTAKGLYDETKNIFNIMCNEKEKKFAFAKKNEFFDKAYKRGTYLGYTIDPISLFYFIQESIRHDMEMSKHD